MKVTEFAHALEKALGEDRMLQLTKNLLSDRDEGVFHFNDYDLDQLIQQLKRRM